MQKTLLVVDKSEFISKIVALMVEGLPYEVLYSSSIEEGIEKARNPIGALLLDVRFLGETDPLSALNEIRALPGLRKTNIVLTHTKTLPFDLQNASQLHSLSVLKKPFTQEELKSALETIAPEQFVEEEASDEVQAVLPPAGHPATLVSPAAVEQIVREVARDVVREVAKEVIAEIAPEILRQTVKEVLTTPPAPASPPAKGGERHESKVKSTA